MQPTRNRQEQRHKEKHTERAVEEKTNAGKGEKKEIGRDREEKDRLTTKRHSEDK